MPNFDFNYTDPRNEDSFEQVQAQVQNGDPVELDQLTMGNSPIYNNQGHMNFAAQREQAQMVLATLNWIDTVGIENIIANSGEDVSGYTPKDGQDAIMASMNDRTGTISDELTAKMQGVVKVGLERETIITKVLDMQTTPNGSRPVAFIEDDNSSNLIAETGNSYVKFSEIEPKELHPQEEQLQGGVSIDVKTIQELPIDPIHSCCNSLKTQIGVKRDRIGFEAFEQFIQPKFNNSLSYTDSLPHLTPQRFIQGIAHLQRSNYEPSVVVMTKWTFVQMLVNEKFIELYSGFDKWNVLRYRKLGKILGVDIIGDLSRGTKMKVLRDNELWYFAHTMHTGKCGDRGGPQITPVYPQNWQRNAIGFMIFDTFHATPGNPHALFKLTCKPVIDINYTGWNYPGYQKP